MDNLLVEFVRKSRKAVFAAAIAGVLAFQAEIVPYVEGTAGSVASAAVASALTGAVTWLLKNDGDPSNDDI